MKNCRNVWGVTSLLYKVPNIDENYVESYTGKFVSAQSNQLDSLKQDLADWINRTLEFRYLTGDNIFQELENGSVLCHLGQVIVGKAKHAISMGLTKKMAPKISNKYFESAMPGSFFSRDNMENFLNFCRSLGVHQNLLFESDDLVLHTHHRNVLLCLIEVARLSGYFGVDPPKLIQLERDIAQEEIKLLDEEIESQLSWQFQSLPARYECEILDTPNPLLVKPPKPAALPSLLKPPEVPHEILDNASFSSLPPVNGGENVKKTKNIKNVCFYEYFQAKMSNETDLPFDELDRKVEEAVKKLHLYCRCSFKKYRNFKFSKIGKSKYNIAGRNVFVRLLKNCRMMVRIGGGWDTLDHFLSRLDPCQANGKYLKPQMMAPNYTKKYTYYNTFDKILRPGESAV